MLGEPLCLAHHLDHFSLLRFQACDYESPAYRTRLVRKGGVFVIVSSLVLPEGHVLLLSDQHPASFDGRYFGPVAATHFRGVVVPVWVFGREAAR